jgi:hypothetical protein
MPNVTLPAARFSAGRPSIVTDFGMFCGCRR